MQATMPSWAPPTATTLAWKGLRLTGADPAATTGGRNVRHLLLRFGRVAELLCLPDEAALVTELSVVDGALDARLWIGLLGGDDAAEHVLDLHAATRSALSQAPTVYDVETVEGAPGPGRPAHGLRVVQGVEELVDDGEVVRSVARFAPPLDPWSTLVDLLAANPGCRLRVAALATTLRRDERTALEDVYRAASRLADGSDLHAPSTRRALRLRESIGYQLEAMSRVAFVVDVLVLHDEPVRETWARTVGLQLTAERDVTRLADRSDRAVPTLVHQAAIAGGFDLEPLRPAELDAVALGLPTQLATGHRRLVDLASLGEVAGLARWPLPSSGPLPGLPARAGAPRLVAPSPATGAVVGRTVDGRPFRLSLHDPGRHAVVLGATGSGKSTLLARVIDEELAAGRRVVLVDPHRQLVDSACVAAGRAGRPWLLFDPAHDRARLSLLDHRAPRVATERAAAVIVDALASSWPAEYTGPVFLANAKAALRVLASVKGAHPLASLADLAADVPTRRLAARGASERDLRALSSLFARRDSNEVATWLLSKFQAISDSAALRQVIAPVGEGLDAAAALDAADLVGLSLDPAVLPRTDGGLLGQAWLSSVLGALLAATGGRETTVVVDEAHRFPSDALVRCLAEGRKYGVSLVLATQSASLATAELQAAIHDNCRTRVHFRTTTDAQAATRFLGAASADLPTLPDLVAFVTQPVDGGMPATATVELDPPRWEPLEGGAPASPEVAPLSDLLGREPGPPRGLAAMLEDLG